MFYTALIITAGVICTTFLWQVAAITFGSGLKPSVLLEWAAALAVSFWNQIGRLVGIISSYLYYIKFGIIKDAVVELCTPLVKLLTSPLEAINGYVKYAMSFAADTELIYLGSVLLVMVLICLHVWLPYVWVYVTKGSVLRFLCPFKWIQFAGQYANLW